MSSSPVPPSLRFRALLLETLLPIAADRGWTMETVREAARDAGLGPGEIALAAPRGVIDLIDAFALWADEQMEAALTKENLLAMRVRERVRAAVAHRLFALAPHKGAEAKAVQALMRPSRATEGPRMAWRSADRVWRMLGDRSTDENYYSKRAILAGVVASTSARWLATPGDDLEPALAFLDRRIDNVMAFEKWKAQAGPMAAMAGAGIIQFARGMTWRR